VVAADAAAVDPRKGRDLRTELEIDLEEAYEGAQKQFTVERPEECDVCEARGTPPEADAETCPQCRGGAGDPGPADAAGPGSANDGLSPL